MSVESFYFCADLDQVQLWWEGSLVQTSEELRSWRPYDDEFHYGLLDERAVKEDLLPHLDDLQEKYAQKQSLGEICKSALEVLINASERAERSWLARLRGRLGSKQREENLKELVWVGSFYGSLALAARKGPVNQLANTKITDIYFVEFLERYMPAEKAAAYNGLASPKIMGPCFPPELEGLDRTMTERLELRMGTPYLVDAEGWREDGARLDSIPGLWEALEAENVGVAAIQHLREIKDIAAYALENNLAMLKGLF